MTVAEVTPASFADDAFASGATQAVTRTVVAGNRACMHMTQGYDGVTVPTVTMTDSQAVADGASWGAMLDIEASAAHGQYMAQFIRDKPFGLSVLTTFTFTSSTTDGGKGICVREFSGSNGSTQHTGNLQDTPGTGTDGVTSGPITPAKAPYLMLGFALDVPGNVTPSTGTGYASSGTGWGFGGTPDTARAENARFTGFAPKAATFTSANNETYISMAVTAQETGAAGPGNGLFFGAGTTS